MLGVFQSEAAENGSDATGCFHPPLERVMCLLCNATLAVFLSPLSQPGRAVIECYLSHPDRPQQNTATTD